MFIMITFFVVCRYTQEGFDVKQQNLGRYGQNFCSKQPWSTFGDVRMDKELYILWVICRALPCFKEHNCTLRDYKVNDIYPPYHGKIERKVEKAEEK